jgi:AraC family carnitine catabolism transcriptional activator
MLTTVLVLEALRFANLTSHAKTFDWGILGVQNKAPKASNGFVLQAQQEFGDSAPEADIIVVNASYFAQEAASDRLSAWLRAAHRRGAWILAIDTAPYLLAQANLLNGRVATIHWEEIDAARTLFPEVDFRGSGHEQSNRILTCSGGLAVIDMMMDFLCQTQGESLMQKVRQCFFLRDAQNELRARDKQLANAVELMAANIATPMPLDEIAKATHRSPRQLQREFVEEFGISPGKFYVAMRLNRAQSLLLTTKFAISDIGYSCGYGTPSWFVKAYKSFFGITPSEERERQSRGKQQAGNRLSMFFQPSSNLIVEFTSTGWMNPAGLGEKEPDDG